MHQHVAGAAVLALGGPGHLVEADPVGDHEGDHDRDHAASESRARRPGPRRGRARPDQRRPSTSRLSTRCPRPSRSSWRRRKAAERVREAGPRRRCGAGRPRAVSFLPARLQGVALRLGEAGEVVLARRQRAVRRHVERDGGTPAGAEDGPLDQAVEVQEDLAQAGSPGVERRADLVDHGRAGPARRGGPGRAARTPPDGPARRPGHGGPAPAARRPGRRRRRGPAGTTCAGPAPPRATSCAGRESGRAGRPRARPRRRAGHRAPGPPRPGAAGCGARANTRPLRCSMFGNRDSG